MAEGVKKCRQCGEIRPLAEFVRNAHGRGLSAANPSGYRARCYVCESQKRTEAKTDSRERHKARDTRRRHAARLAASPYAPNWPRPIDLDSLTEFYGWTNDLVEAELRRAVEVGVCEGCGDRYALPAKGDGPLADVQVDILDPAKAPFWGVNTRVVCGTCNRQKGRTSALDMALAAAERRALMAEAARRLPYPADPEGVPTLFDL